VTTAAEVAAWMKTTVDAQGVLDQQVAVIHIMGTFGDRFIRFNEGGNLAIVPSVLSAFNKITGDAIVWERAGRLWRKREIYDMPGRQQP
jgi:hypothetical protein